MDVALRFEVRPAMRRMLAIACWLASACVLAGGWLPNMGQAKEPPAPATKPAPAAAGQAVPLIPRDVLFGNPERAAARISPDGKQLSFLAPRDGVLNIYVAPLDAIGEAKPVTSDTKRGIRTYFWAYTSQHILYQQDADGDEDWHIFCVDLAAGTTKDLTQLDKVSAQIEGVTYRQPTKLLVGLNDRDPQLHDLYLVDLLTAERTLVEKNPGFAGYLADEDLKIRFASKFSPTGGSQLFEPDGKGGWKPFLEIPAADVLTTRPMGFDASGKHLYLIDSRERDTGALTSIDLATGQQTLIAEDPRADISGVLAHPTKNTIEAVSFTYERKQWKILDDSIQGDLAYLRTVADGDIEVTSRTLDDTKWTVAYLMDDGPVRYYVYDRQAKAAKFLFTNRDELAQWPLVKMHPVVIKSRDGLNLVSYLSLPKGAAADGIRPASPLPLILNVHGGPWARDSWGFDPEHQLWANRGYAILSVNFRGSTGFGKAFGNAGNQEWGAKMHNDLLDAVKWAVDQKIADPQKICIMGGSYGGYATLVGLTFTPEVFACGIDVVGPSSLITLLNTIPPYWAPVIEVFKTRVGDHQTDEGKKFLESRSPLSFVDKIQRPLLIGQGKNDPRVKESEANQIVAAMKAKKIPVTYVLFPDEGHGFARPQNNMAFTAVSEAFLAQILGGRYEPIGDALKESSITVPEGAAGVPGLEAALEAKK